MKNNTQKQWERQEGLSHEQLCTIAQVAGINIEVARKEMDAREILRIVVLAIRQRDEEIGRLTSVISRITRGLTKEKQGLLL